MALKSTFRQADIRKMLEAGIKEAKAQMLQVIKRLGEESVQLARANADAIDATGKLAASIGYVIVAEGMVIASDFSRSPVQPSSTPDEEAGNRMSEAQQGEALAYELAKGYLSGYALIVVSGSEYAVQAESMSKDVLTGAEMYVARALPELLGRLTKGKV